MLKANIIQYRSLSHKLDISSIDVSYLISDSQSDKVQL